MWILKRSYKYKVNRIKMLTELFFFFFSDYVLLMMRLCSNQENTYMEILLSKKKKKANFVMDNTQLIQLKVRIKILEFYQIL